MAKPLTLNELHAALKPIMEAINKLREDTSAYSSELSEIHNMTTNISVKIDTLEQTAGATLSEISKPGVKKTTGRKPAAPKKPTIKKAPMKKGVAKSAESEAPEAEDPAVDETEDPVADEAEDPVVEEEAENSDESSKKAPPKKAAPKKSVAKKPSKTAAKAPVQRLNKMTLFKDIYKSNPSRFDKYLTKAVKKAIDAENDKLKDLTGEALATAQRNAYYTYMREKHDDVLDSLKTEVTVVETPAEESEEEDQE